MQPVVQAFCTKAWSNLTPFSSCSSHRATVTEVPLLCRQGRGLHRCQDAARSPLRRPSVAALRSAHPPGAGGGHLAAWESVEDP